MRRLIIPRTLRLRGALYRVVIDRQLHERTGHVGEFSEAARTITIDGRLRHPDREEVLLHEILHAVMPGAGHHDTTEEALVEAIDSPLLEALRQLRWEDS